jgi:hypothetical protein
MVRAIAAAMVTLMMCSGPGCQDTPERTAPPHDPVGGAPPRDVQPPHDDRANIPPIHDEPYDGPQVRVQVMQMPMEPPRSSAHIEITVPTGGWTLNLDESHIIKETAKLFLTLERPCQDEMVTQALVTHREEFTGDRPFSRVEVYVHLAQRDIQTFTTNYRLAARSGAAP